MRLAKRTVLAVVLCWVALPSSQALGEIAVQPNGKLVVSRDGLIARFLPDGSLDRSFGGNGYVKSPAPYYTGDIAVRPNGKLLVDVGRRVLQLNTDGKPDPSFGTGNGIAWSAGNFLTLLPDGRLLVAGSWSGGCGGIRGGPFYSVASISRLLPDGTPDPSFDGDGFVYLRASDPCGFDPSQGFSTQSYSFTAAPAVQADGKIVAGGTRTLARFLPDGSLDSSFGGGDGVTTPDLSINDLGVLPDDRIVIGAGTSGALTAARFLADGSPDPSFGDDGISRIAVDAGGFGDSALFREDGAVVLAGNVIPCRGMSSAGPGPCSRNLVVARLTPGGEIDSTFGGEDGVVLADTVGRLGSPDLLRTDGRLIVEASAFDRAFPVSALFAYSPDGHPDPNFGENGVVLPPPLPRTCAGRPLFGGSLYRGTPEADQISTNPNDTGGVILTYGGNDTIDASRFARLLICSGSGDDLVLGNGDRQVVSGGFGVDSIFLRAGNDKGSGGPGDDLLTGGAGDDLLFGGKGMDDLRGGPGQDRLIQDGP